MRSLIALVVPSFALLVACSSGGSAPSAAEPESEDALHGSVAGARIYDCRGFDHDTRTLGHFQLELKSNKATITDLDKDPSKPDSSGPKDDYNPTTPAYQGATMFDSFRNLGDNMSDVTGVALIASEALMKAQGKKNLKAWLRFNSGEGPSTSGFQCDQKQAVVKIDTAHKARLVCTVGKYDCAHDSPPGDTCLFDLNVMQKGDDDATMKLTFLDHFGVRATERAQTLDNPSQFSRTKETIKGKWGDYSIKMDYRDGIAYFGELHGPDGKKGNVTCSDLAMLDTEVWADK